MRRALNKRKVEKEVVVNVFSKEKEVRK